MRLASTWNTVLPIGFRFAIVDRAGAVLHHSDEDLALEENLFQASGNNPTLATVVESGRARRLDLDYHGQKQRALVVPLSGSPWTLVVLAECNYIETIVLEAVLSSLALLVCMLAGIGLLRLLFMLKSRASSSPWAWPSRTREKVVKYRLAVCLFALMAFAQVAWALAWKQWSWPFALACAALTLLSLPHLLGQGRHGHRLVGAVVRWRPRNPVLRALLPGASNAYMLAMTGLLLVLAICPAIGFFYARYETTMHAFAALSARQLREDLTRRERVMHEAYLHVSGPRPCSGGANSRSPLCRLGVYLPTQLDKLPAGGGEASFADGAPPDLFDPFALLPAFNPVARALRETTQPADPVRQQALATVMAQLTAFPGSRDMPAFAGGFALLLGFLCWAVRLTARRVYGLGREPASAPLLPASKRWLDVDYVLHLYMPEGAVRELQAEACARHGEAVLFIDLRHPDWEAQSGKPCSHLILHHFENLLLRPEVAARALLLLETRVYSDNVKIAICSLVDPVYYLNERRQDWKSLHRDTNGDSTQDGRPAGIAADELPDVIRWAQLFSRFDRVHHVPASLQLGPPAAETAMHGRPTGELTNHEMVRKLEVECGWDDQLHMIAAALQDHATQQPLTGERLLSEIGGRAASRYRFLWSLCTNTEKLLLTHLAQEGALNPCNWDTASVLASRGLLRFEDGRFDFVSETFRRFVLEAMRPEDIEKLQQLQHGTWRQISIPLGTLLVLGFAFFSWSQPGVAEMLTGILGASAASAAAIIKLLGAGGIARPSGGEQG